MSGSHPRLHMLVTEGRTIQSVLTMLTCDMVGQQSHHLILVCDPNFLVLSTSVPASTGFVPFLMEQEYAPQDTDTRTFDASGRPATSIKEARDVLLVCTFTRTLFTLAARDLIFASGLSSDIFNGQYAGKWRIRPVWIRGLMARNHVEEQCGTERTLDQWPLCSSGLRSAAQLDCRGSARAQ